MRKAYLVPHPPIIVPGIGEGTELVATRASYEAIAKQIAQEQPETLIIATPHGVSYSDYIQISSAVTATGNFGDFQQKGISFKVDYDIPLIREIEKRAKDAELNAGTMGEQTMGLDHGVMVPLYFLKATKIVRISVSGLPLIDHYQMGMVIAQACQDKSVIFIASGDMSHKLTASGPYGFAPEGKIHDEYIAKCIRENCFLDLFEMDPKMSAKAASCGDPSLAMLMGFLDGCQIESHILSYEGPFGVGYLTASFSEVAPAESLFPTLLTRQEERCQSTDPYVCLARQSIEIFVKTGKPMTLDGLPPDIENIKAGVFVSIHKGEDLRGCIGTLEPQQANVALEIIQNGISASTRDPRFSPIQTKELNSLTIHVDVLSPSEPIESKEELDVNRYGVIVTLGNRKGVLLPCLDGVDTVDDQIRIALQKAGIRASEPYSMRRFEVRRHI
jgi:AmmeMemoRadiSam system protein A